MFQVMEIFVLLKFLKNIWNIYLITWNIWNICNNLIIELNKISRSSIKVKINVNSINVKLMYKIVQSWEYASENFLN